MKEQEALGWAGAEQLPVLTADGTYSLSASGTQNAGAVIGYKMNIPAKTRHFTWNTEISESLAINMILR